MFRVQGQLPLDLSRRGLRTYMYVACSLEVAYQVTVTWSFPRLDLPADERVSCRWYSDDSDHNHHSLASVSINHGDRHEQSSSPIQFYHIRRIGDIIAWRAILHPQLQQHTSLGDMTPRRDSTISNTPRTTVSIITSRTISEAYSEPRGQKAANGQGLPFDC